MNKTYYIGYLEKINSSQSFNDPRISIYLYNSCNFEEKNIIANLLTDCWYNNRPCSSTIINNGVFDSKINRILNSKIKSNISNPIYNEYIIFEIIRNENNHIFAKEIYTKVLFPILDLNDIEIQYDIVSIKKDTYTMNSNYNSILDYNFTLNASYKYNGNESNKINNFIYLPHCKIASQEDIYNYLKNIYKTKNILDKFNKNTKLINKILKLSKENIFENENSIKKKKVLK